MKGAAALIRDYANQLEPRTFRVERARARHYEIRFRDPEVDSHELARVYEYSAGVYRLMLNIPDHYSFKLCVIASELEACTAWFLGCWARARRGERVHPAPPVALGWQNGQWYEPGNYQWSLPAMKNAGMCADGIVGCTKSECAWS